MRTKASRLFGSLLLCLSLAGCSGGHAGSTLPLTGVPTTNLGSLLITPSFDAAAKTAGAQSIESQTASYEVWVLDDAETDVEAGPLTFQKSASVLRVSGIAVDSDRNTVVVEAHNTAGDTVGVSVQKVDIVAGEQPLGAPIHRSLSGRVRFEQVPVSDDGLSYAAAALQPIVAARVSLLDDASGETLAETVSRADGAWCFDTQGLAGNVRVRVWSETREPAMQVVDNTSGGAVYAVDSTPVAAGTAHLDLDARVVWSQPTGYTVRSGAPFAVLEACRRAAASFRTARPALVLPPLTVNWSVNNAPASGDVSQGEIGTSHYSDGQLYILGKENQDTDEFDWHVMVHEWGHYYEDRLSRSDSVGGSHGLNDLLDARVALGEGWGNALSAMILYPDSVYRDTSGPNQAATGLSFDIEDNTDPVAGWSSEQSVQAILYDVFDPPTAAEQAFDQVATGLGPIHDVMVGPERSTAALTTIFSFIDGCQRTVGGFAAQVTPLLARHKLAPVRDAFGTGETNNGGDPANLPLFRRVEVDGPPVTVTLTRSDANTNRASANRYLPVRPVQDGPLQVTLSSEGSLRLDLYKNGSDVGGVTYDGGSDSLSFDLGPVRGTDVLVLVVSGLTPARTYDASVSVTQ